MESDKKTITDIVKSYARYLKLERNYSPNTLAAYQNDLSWLLSFCEQQEMNPLDMQLEDLQHFAVQLHEHQIGPTSQARILSGIRSFYKYLLLSGEIEQDPTELLESPHLGERLPEVLSTDEIDQIQKSICLLYTSDAATTERV